MSTGRGRLVVTRGLGQEVRIGPDIVVRVVEFTRGKRLKIAIEAPRSIVVDRGEVADAKAREPMTEIMREQAIERARGAIVGGTKTRKCGRCQSDDRGVSTAHAANTATDCGVGSRD